MPDEAIECIQGSSGYSFQVSSFQESDFLESLNRSSDQVDPDTGEEIKNPKRDIELSSSFC